MKSSFFIGDNYTIINFYFLYIIYIYFNKIYIIYQRKYYFEFLNEIVIIFKMSIKPQNANSNQKTARSTSSAAKTKPILMAGASLTNLHSLRKGPLDHFYINPTVTREGQKKLAEKLHHEIESEAQLDEEFKTREKPKRIKDKEEDHAKIFNDFCIAFIDSSKEIKDNVTNAISQAQDRLTQLDDLRNSLVEIERRNYRFEMNLPNPIESDDDGDENADDNEEEDL